MSLSGKTRLTYREAVALLRAANEGQANWDERADDGPFAAPEAQYSALERAIDKLKDALGNVGGYRDDGTLIDPFESAAAEGGEG